MADQTAQSTQPRPIELYAAATRELAQSLRFLGEMIRDSAPTALELEWTPCPEGDCDDAEELPGTSTLLPLAPVESRREPQGSASLCRPGGCGCGERAADEGRHAQRTGSIADDDPANADAGAR